MSGFNNLREMNLGEDTQVTLTYSDGNSVIHCHETHIEETVQNTDVVDRVAEVITNGNINVETEWGGNPLESMRDSMLLEDYPRDFSGFAEFVAEVMKENIYDVECIDHHTEQYDYKRGYTTLTATLKTTIGDLLASPTSHFIFAGWEAGVQTPIGNLSFKVDPS
jgi:hypothetical protein